MHKVNLKSKYSYRMINILSQFFLVILNAVVIQYFTQDCNDFSNAAVI